MLLHNLSHQQLTHLESLPNRTPEDQDSIDLLKKHLQGGTNERGGTLQNYIACMAAENNPRESSGHLLSWLFVAHVTIDAFDFPRHSSHVDLRTLGPGYYGLVF